MVYRHGSKRGGGWLHHSGRHAGHLSALCRPVVPVLQARGLFRTDYPGTTLRESLGLDEPKNQFTQQ